MLGIFKTPSYSGADSYKYVENLIRQGRRILIVSPYIDRYYANFILSHSSGKSYHIISSSIEDGAKKLLTNGRFPTEFFASTSLFFAADIMLLYLNLMQYFAYLTIVVAAMAALTFHSLTRRRGNINLKLPNEFVHAKIYISENQAINGSANLTYKGMHKNIEHVELTDDSNEIQRLEKQFWKLWNR
ncbi:MAG: hypothetical protein KGH49_00970 [Candidatus Micrarchaeota archaeon]|nr:hypothetical protein [Candidatus Micrarchaeota archaeon]